MGELRNQYADLITLGEVRTDGTPDIASVLFRFPVPHSQMRIRQAIRIDKQKIPGRSGSVKQSTGYEDAEIEIRIKLADDEDKSGDAIHLAVEHFALLQQAFRDRGNADSLPRVFSIASRLTDACAIKTVLFTGIEVGDTVGSNDLDVTISFVEFEPIALQVEKQALSQEVLQQTSEQAQSAADRAGLEEELGVDVDSNRLTASFRAGIDTAMGSSFDGQRPGDDPEEQPQ